MLVIVRMCLPYILLNKANAYLDKFSHNYYLHINDLEISVVRMSYRFNEVTGKIKETNQEFLKIKSIDVSIAWRELFKGRILTDVNTKNLHFLVIKDIKKFASPKKESKDIKDTLFPVKVERFDLLNASVTFENYRSFTDDSNLKITNMNGRITNINPTKKFPFSFFNLTADLLNETSVFKIVGELNQLKNPPDWILSMEVRDFQLHSLNPYLVKHVPLTFNSGEVDMYSEIKSENEKIVGYVKPFFKKVDVIANKQKFVNIKHFGFEIITALANLILREPKSKSVASILEFEYDKKFKLKVGKAISKAVNCLVKLQLIQFLMLDR